jgi:hypothetical protein
LALQGFDFSLCQLKPKAQLTNEILEVQRLSCARFDETGRVASTAIYLMENPVGETPALAVRALVEQLQILSKGGAMLLFHHF